MKLNIKLVFFVREGLDTFIDDIIKDLSNLYETRKIIVKDFMQIDEGMKWGDVCWFEWCDELVIYGSHHKQEGIKIICRLHSYEAFTPYPNLVDWENVDYTIFVAEHIRTTVLKSTSIAPERTGVIQNGVHMDKFNFSMRSKGFNIAYAGYINYKKGPMLLLQTIKAITENDDRYRLFIAGEFQDLRYVQYFRQMLDQMKLNKNVFYEGWQSDLNSWLEDKHYILCTSVLESQGMGIMQAMSKGIKPVVHNFVGAKEIYPESYVWNTTAEACRMVFSEEYNPIEYRKFIEDNYEYRGKINRIIRLINDISESN